MAGYYKEEHSYIKFNRDLNSRCFKNIVFLYGEEEYLIDWAASSLVKAYVHPAMKALDYVKIEDENIPIEELIEICETPSIGQGKRVVWAKNFEPLKNPKAKGCSKELIQQFVDYLENPNEGTVLILSTGESDKITGLMKQVKQVASSYKFTSLDKKTLGNFALKRFQNAGIKIDNATINFLIEETGYFHKQSEYRIGNLENDIKKIIAHCEGERVSMEDISQTLTGDMDIFVYSFLDAVSKNQKHLAFQLLNNILSSSNDIYMLLGAFISHFEIILCMKECREDGFSMKQSIEKLEIHPYRGEKAFSYANNFTLEKLKNLLGQLYDTDKQIKTGTLEPRLALELILGRI